MDELARHVRRGEWDVIVPGSEASLLPISAGRDELEPHVALGLPPHAGVLRALDKVFLRQTAVAAKLPPPPSLDCETSSAASAAAAEIGYPLIVKPLRSFRQGDDDLVQKSAQVVLEPQELDDAVARVGTPATVQRYVSNPRIVSCAGVRTGTGLVGFTVTRYMRTWPPSAGSAAFAATVAPPPGLRDRVEKLVEALGWSGIFELEFLELEDGSLGAIDFNPRVFGWLSLAIGAGANLPAIWCDHMLGRAEAGPADAEPGRRYRWEEGEIKYVVRNLRHLDRSALSPLRPARHVVHACFELRDPVPFFVQAAALARQAVAGRTPGLAPTS